MKHRLYLALRSSDHLPLRSSDRVTLSAERSHYLTRVLRLKSNAELLCFDGSGIEYHARLHNVSTKACVLELGECSRAESAPAERIHLALGVLKGSAMDRAIQKSTELGATDIWPILAERSNAHPTGEREARKRIHWQRVIESATEQSRRLFLPELHGPVTLATFLAASPAEKTLFLDIDQAVLPAVLPRQSTALLIGPEGGWSQAERDKAFDSGAVGFSLGDFVLRAETTPLAVLAALRHAWRWC